MPPDDDRRGWGNYLMAQFPQAALGFAAGVPGYIGDMAMMVPDSLNAFRFWAGNANAKPANPENFLMSSDWIGSQMGADVNSPGFMAGNFLSMSPADIARMSKGARIFGSAQSMEAPPMILTKEAKEKALKAYNENKANRELMFRRFIESKDGEGFSYQTLTLEDLEDIYGDLDEAVEYVPDAVELARRDGSVVELAKPDGADFFSVSKAPSESEFYRDAMIEKGWSLGDDLSSFDDILNPDVEPFALHMAFESIAEELDGFDIQKVDSSGDSAYYWLTRRLTPEEMAKAGDNADRVVVGVRVSNHSNQSATGHATRGKHKVDINIAPKQGRGNEHHWADSFESAIDKLSMATVDDKGNVIFRRSSTTTGRL